MTHTSDIIADDPGAWDVVIVGTGMGGATLGWQLAAQGAKVLFLEKGRADIARGRPDGQPARDPDARLREGRWPDHLDMALDGHIVPLEGMRGCGVGGSTLLYAALLERLEPHDLAATPSMPHPTGGWPIDMTEMAPWYTRAEQLLRVAGTQDPLTEDTDTPLRDPRPATRLDAQLMADFEQSGLNPYRCHVGIAYLEDCDECLGHACPRRCKSDTQWLCVAPAVQRFGAELWSECEVTAIEADATTVRGVICRQGGLTRRVRARIVVLAAGALATPLLLLASANAHHPSGLANASGMVGRNLMFHAVNWLALWPSRRVHEAATGKAISARDFYRLGTLRGGTLQSVARKVYSSDIAAFLQATLDRTALRRFSVLRRLLKFPAKAIEILAGNASVFALLVEDLPYPENRIERDSDGRPRVTYNIPSELARRNARLRQAVSRRLRRNRHLWLNGSVALNEGHACGTCRFGTDPRNSVLDPNGRAHDVDNLYVVDASFMPTSGGTNPGLTIAANALRVADIIGQRLSLDQSRSQFSTAGRAPVP